MGGIESRYCPDCERNHIFSIGGHAFEPGPSGRCTYCGGRKEHHVTRATTPGTGSDLASGIRAPLASHSDPVPAAAGSARNDLRAKKVRTG